MKSILLYFILVLSCATTYAQEPPVEELPAGRYEAVLKGSNARWNKGDIAILDDSRYRITATNETGEYKFSVTAQRVFFTSGPLKNFFARTTHSGKTPVIILPSRENEQLGHSVAAADVLAYFRQ